MDKMNSRNNWKLIEMNGFFKKEFLIIKLKKRNKKSKT
jgi:hypothetical protein